MTKKKSFFSDLTNSDVVGRITSEQQRKLNDIPPESENKRKGRNAAKSCDPIVNSYMNFNGSNLVVQISPQLKKALDWEKLTRDDDPSTKLLVCEAIVNYYKLKLYKSE